MLFENAPHFVERLAAADYADWDDVLARGEQLARTLPEDERLELIDELARIGALQSSISATSYREQGYDHDPGTNVVQVYIGYLRRRLALPDSPAPIKTVRSVGYRLAEDG